MTPPESDTVAWQTVTQVAEQLHRDPDRAVDLDTLARDAGYERTHFAKLFRQVMGQPPARYARALRLERAALQLEGTNRPLVRIGLDAGYSSGDAFARAFRKRFGLSPSRFREQVRASAPWTPADPPVGLRMDRAERVTRSITGWALPPRSDPAELQADLDQIAGSGHVGDADTTWGALSRPWGWTHPDGGVEGPHFQAVVWTPSRPVPSPFRPLWVDERGWLTVAWEGDPWAVSDAIVWLHEHGLAERRLRSGFAPSLTLWSGRSMAGPLTVWIPVEPILDRGTS